MASNYIRLGRKGDASKKASIPVLHDYSFLDDEHTLVNYVYIAGDGQRNATRVPREKVLHRLASSEHKVSVFVCRMPYVTRHRLYIYLEHNLDAPNAWYEEQRRRYSFLPQREYRDTFHVLYEDSGGPELPSIICLLGRFSVGDSTNYSYACETPGLRARFDAHWTMMMEARREEVAYESTTECAACRGPCKLPRVCDRCGYGYCGDACYNSGAHVGLCRSAVLLGAPVARAAEAQLAERLREWESPADHRYQRVDALLRYVIAR